MIGIFLPDFPTQTHIFFWREIVALRELGQPVAIVSTTRPDPARCPHAFGAEAAAETHYVFPPRPLAVGRGLVPHPIAMARALRYVAGLRESSWRQKLRVLALLPSAADLRDYARRKGITHIHYHSCANSAHIAALCDILGGPTYSLTLHGDLPVYGTDHDSKMARASFVATAGSHLTSQIIEKAGIPAERIVPSWMGVDTQKFVPGGRGPGRPGRLHFVTVARLNPAKGHAHALAAMRRILDADPTLDLHYTIAGEGPYRAEVEAVVRRLGLADHVAMPGSLSEDQVLDLLRRSDAFVLPSVGVGEAGPVAMMEAMACGLPVICSDIGSTALMIDHGEAGILVAQADESGLADAFLRLARDPEQRHRLGEAARRRAVDLFDCRRTAAALLQSIRRHAAPVAH